jgi:hypothetical protein
MFATLVGGSCVDSAVMGQMVVSGNLRQKVVIVFRMPPTDRGEERQNNQDERERS